MDRRLNAAITRLVLKAFEAADISDRDWHTRFKIGGARLTRLRAGQASLTDVELNRISRVTGEPWQNLVLGLLGGEDAVSQDARELVGALHSLKRSADAEAAERGERKHFNGLRQLMRKKSV